LPLGLNPQATKTLHNLPVDVVNGCLVTQVTGWELADNVIPRSVSIIHRLVGADESNPPTGMCVPTLLKLRDEPDAVGSVVVPPDGVTRKYTVNRRVATSVAGSTSVSHVAHLSLQGSAKTVQVEGANWALTAGVGEPTSDPVTRGRRCRCTWSCLGWSWSHV
jgi:hypothetical protein